MAWHNNENIFQLFRLNNIMLRKRMGRKHVASMAFALVFVMCLSSVSYAGGNGASASTALPGGHSPSFSDVAFLGNLSGPGAAYSGNLNVLVMFNFSHEASLQALLDGLSNPLSPEYQHYLTASQFNAEFAPPANIYDSAASYFSQEGLQVKDTYQNRLVLSLSGTAGEFSAAFNTTITAAGSEVQFAPSAQPQLPSWLSGHVSDVIGLTGIQPQISLNTANMGTYNVSSGSFAGKSAYVYPQMQYTKTGIQLMVGSYMQVAYNETPLLSRTANSHPVIATILWSGSYTTSSGITESTAPFYPTDIYTYFNTTMPASQPKPTVYGVPINGAPLPGISSQKDTSGASLENTLDLEMAGSVAPGASIYNVYGPNSTFTDLTTAFEKILSPGTTSGLDNVSVISNSWGANDSLSNTWNQLLQESQARGITVLASSGDSGNAFNSSKSVSSTEYVQFPSTVGYNTYGVVAVGGTNVSLYDQPALSNYLSIRDQQAWFIPASTNHGDTLGSVGGISQLYQEPSWQVNSQANTVLNYAGRGVPDIAALANNTLIHYTNTTQTGPDTYYIVAGTSVAAPLVAGIIAEMNAYRASTKLGPLGFLNPAIYRLGTDQYSGSSGMALKPFYDIVQGHNAVYSALPGYDLVTGMGSIDAHNFVTDLGGREYNVSFVESGMNAANNWSVTVEGHIYNSTGAFVNMSLINGTYFFQVPVVGYNVSDPVAGNFTVNGANVTIALQFRHGYQVTFNQYTLPVGREWVFMGWNYTESSMSSSLTLYFPNGTYSYAVRPADPNYYGSNGTFTVNGSAFSTTVVFIHGIFNITFVQSGLPTGQKWSISNGTVVKESSNSSITFTSYGGEFTFDILPAGAYIANHTRITLDTAGQNRTVYLNFSYGYFITFAATGVASGDSWTLLIGEYNITSSNSTHVVEVQNGTHNFNAYYPGGSIATHIQGNVTVSGQNVTVHLDFSSPARPLEYYVLYIGLFALGLIILVIGLLKLRKK